MPANLDSNTVTESAWKGEQSQVRARRVVSDFEYGETLGEGSYSTVAAAKDKQSGRVYAIKILDKRHIIKEKKSKYVEIEKKALHRMDHPGIVKLYWTFQDPTSLYYVLDLAKNGELLRYIKKLGAFDLETTRFYVAEILSAVEHVHSRGVIHRDVKPENILLDDNMHIKLTDFGTAKILEADIGAEGQEDKEERASSFVGTAEYVSPELLTDKSACKASDFWAIGCITYQLLVGRPPFKGSNEYQTFQKIIKLEYSFPDGFNEVARDIVSKLLISDPANRLGGGPDGVTDIKSHPFFEDIDWDNLFKSEAPRLRPYLPRGTNGETELRSDNDLFMGSGFREGRRDPFIEMLGRSGEEMSYPDPLLVSEGIGPNDVGDVGDTENNDTGGVEGFTDEKDENLGRGIGDDATRDRRRRLEEQKDMPWFKHLGENEICLRTGIVNKRKGFIFNKRILVLTDAPRLLYFTQEKIDHMGEINWSTKIVPELKGRKHFFVHTPKKTYYFEDPAGKAQDWVNDINQSIVDKFGPAA